MADFQTVHGWWTSAGVHYSWNISLSWTWLHSRELTNKDISNAQDLKYDSEEQPYFCIITRLRYMSCIKLAVPLMTLRTEQPPYLILKGGGGLQGVAGCFYSAESGSGGQRWSRQSKGSISGSWRPQDLCEGTGNKDQMCKLVVNELQHGQMSWRKRKQMQMKVRELELRGSKMHNVRYNVMHGDLHEECHSCLKQSQRVKELHELRSLSTEAVKEL